MPKLTSEIKHSLGQSEAIQRLKNSSPAKPTIFSTSPNKTPLLLGAKGRERND